MFETKTQTVDLFAPDKSTGAKSIPMTIDPNSYGKDYGILDEVL